VFTKALSVHFVTERIEVVLTILSRNAVLYGPFCIADGDMHPVQSYMSGLWVLLFSDVCLNVPGEAHMARALA